MIESLFSFLMSHIGLIFLFCAAWLFFSDSIKAFFTNGGNVVASLVTGATQVASPDGQAEVKAMTTEVEDAIAALHTVTEYAINTGSPGLVTEVSALYTSITSLIAAHNAPAVPVAPAPQIIYVQAPVSPAAPAPVAPGTPIVPPAPVRQ